VELVVEDVETGKLCVNMTTPRLVLPLSEHLHTIDEKTGDMEPPDLEVPTADVEPTDDRPKIGRNKPATN